MQRISALILVFLFGFQPLIAQDEVQAILDEMPAANERMLNRLMRQLVDQGDMVVETLSQALDEDEKLKEKAQYTLSGMAKFLGKQDPQSYPKIEAAYIKEINRHQDLEVKVFLLEQFQFFATDRSLPELRNLVRSLCDPALAVITQIGGSDALQTMIASYETAGDYCKQSLAKAIAEFDGPKATNMLEKIATSAEVVPKVHIMPLLAKRGAPSSMDILQNFAKSKPDMGQHLLLDHASIMAKKGNPTALVEQAENLLSAQASNPVTQKAVKMLARYGGPAGKKLLLKTFKKGDPDLTAMIVQSIDGTSTISLATLFKRINKVGPTTQIGLLNEAIRQKYTDALPTARSLLSVPDVHVQATAVRAISSLGKQSSLPILQQTIRETRDPFILETAAAEMSRWIDTTNVDLLGNLLNQTTGPAKATLISMVADRGLSTLFSTVKDAVQSSDVLERQSAFASLPKLAYGRSLAELVTIAPHVKSDDERSALVQALVVNVNERKDKTEATQELVRLIGGDPQIIQGVLPKIGGKTAMQTVNEKFANQPRVYEEILKSWETPDALGILIARARDKAPDDDAIRTILRLANHPDLPSDQKFLHLRDLLSITSDLPNKERVLRSMGNTRTPGAFDFVAGYLDDDKLRTAAAETLVNMALPPAGEKYGLIGDQVRRQLMRADTILSQTDQDYTKAFLQNYLASLPSKDGYVRIFNGVDLTGWKGLVGNPISRDTMFGLQRQTLEREVARSLPERWIVEDGILTYVGDGFDNLCTVKKYRDFELVMDWRIEKDADSGVYLRGTPQVQIWDAEGSEEQNAVGSGGLFNNEIHENTPITPADNPAGEWNTFRIIMIDDKVTVYLNGILVTDRVVLENYWDRSLPIFREEQIELQAHTTKVQFRDIYIRELHGAPVLTEMEIRQGFKPLFNGINLDGWVGNKTDYVAENGEIVIYPGAGGKGNLFTAKEYENFRLRFEFKLTPGANNGLGIHAPLEGDAAYVGKELQILDNTAEKYANLKDYQYHGSVYGLVAARRGELKPVGDWNTQEVVMKNNRISVVLNNQRILSADLNIIARNGTLDGKDHPGLKRTKGHIGFLGHGDQVHFRNIRILEILDEEEN